MHAQPSSSAGPGVVSAGAASVGLPVGSGVTAAAAVGVAVGAAVGLVGAAVGAAVGETVGLVGGAVGAAVGETVTTALHVGVLAASHVRKATRGTAPLGRLTFPLKPIPAGHSPTV